jgi:hypothetical protein
MFEGTKAEFVEKASKRKQELEFKRLESILKDTSRIGKTTTAKIKANFAAYYTARIENGKSYEESLELAGFSDCWKKSFRPRYLGGIDFHRYVLCEE